MSSFDKNPHPSFLGPKFFVALFIVIMVILSGLIIFFYPQLQEFANSTSSTNRVDLDTEELIAEVGQLYLLPDEIPTIATISDRSQLPEAEFFNKAEEGDKVLFYKTANVSIIYRPSIRKVVNVGSFNLDQLEESTSSEPQELEEVEVLLLNGTTTVGLTTDASDELEGLEFMNIVDRLDAVEKPYEQSLVIYLQEEFLPQAEIIASSLSATVTPDLPVNEEESSSSADIVIILGDDYASSRE